ncbi:MAG: BlaI/MecI/CopY family transcriptional regulator [Planctomycetes bacterium]|nr:BlaI/MecI/CopY family transcriptional regulator [Planctomycetota bacterium]
MADKPLDDLGPLQREIMEAVWKAGRATVRDVQKSLGKHGKALAYTTVLSAMQKLERFGWLTHESEGRTYIYRAAHTRGEAGVGSLRQYVQRVFKGDSRLLLRHLLDDEQLDEEDLDALRRMIDARRKELRDE